MGRVVPQSTVQTFTTSFKDSDSLEKALKFLQLWQLALICMLSRKKQKDVQGQGEEWRELVGCHAMLRFSLGFFFSPSFKGISCNLLQYD